MKLYEFTFTDNKNLAESAILETLEDFLLTEAEMQGWAVGYNLRQCKEVIQTSEGKRIYTFEVLGQYVDSNSLDFSDDIATESAKSTKGAAAKEADL